VAVAPAVVAVAVVVVVVVVVVVAAVARRDSLRPCTVATAGVEETVGPVAAVVVVVAGAREAGAEAPSRSSL
jgi:hypothetical protein